MPIIRAKTPIVTQINVFTVPSGGQQALIDYLAEAAQVSSEVDGWISASLHRRFDGTRVANYAQSWDEDAAHRVIDHLKGKGLIDGIKPTGKPIRASTRWSLLSNDRIDTSLRA